MDKIQTLKVPITASQCAIGFVGWPDSGGADHAAMHPPDHSTQKSGADDIF
jgi:hypothetical protein